MGGRGFSRLLVWSLLGLAGCSFRVGGVVSAPASGSDADLAGPRVLVTDLAPPGGGGGGTGGVGGGGGAGGAGGSGGGGGGGGNGNGAADLAMATPLPDLGQPPIQPVLTASIDPSTVTPIDQTAGTSDWAHWGLTDRKSFDHKSGGAIGNFINLQNTMVKQLGNYPIAFSWTGGTPTATTTNTTTGVYTRGDGAGFRITVPADTTLHTLKLYGGGQQATVILTAHLTDGSAPDVTLSSADASNNFQRVATVTYRAAAPCQLTVDWALQSGGGFVHLQSVTVQ